MKKILFISIVCIIMIGCAEYSRQPNCHLDALNVNGNVIKIETVVDSHMPLTEMFYYTLDPKEVVQAADGNYVLEFDKHGSLKQYSGYGIDGDLLFKIKRFPSDSLNLYPFAVGATDMDRSYSLKTHTDKSSVETKIFAHDTLQYILRMHKLENGDVDYITKEYAFLEIKISDDYSLKYYDTTYRNYLKYDEYGNWIEMLVDNHGFMKKHNYTYTVRRQITYADQPKKPALLNQLKCSKPGNIFRTGIQNINIPQVASFSLPIYMKSNSQMADMIENEMLANFNCLFTYNGDDAYATFSIQTLYERNADDWDNLSASDMAYDKEVDALIYEQMTNTLSLSNTYILKWIPYCFTRINGKPALCIRYYRYGKGSSIPVYVEIYTLKMRNGKSVNFTLSYQSNHYDRFHDDFERTIESIKLN